MIRAAIVGCGNIAGFLDTPADESRIVTHAHAYSMHPDIELVACCDPDPEQRERFCRIWGETIRSYESVEAMLAAEEVQMLSICAPTPFHAAAMEEALGDPHIRTIICEKPFTETVGEFERLLPLLEDTHKEVLINFMRRYDPSIRNAAQIIAGGELGEMLHFSGTFTKGLYHNGSHMLELVEHLCGPIMSVAAPSCRMENGDLYGSFYLETAKARGSLNNESGDAYALFELDVVLSRGRIRIMESGHRIEVETLQPSREYAGYYNLKPSGVLDDTMRKNLYHTVVYALSDHQGVLEAHLRLSRKLLDIKSRLCREKTLEWSRCETV